MAKSVGSSAVVLLIAFLVISTLAMPMVEASSKLKKCKRASTSFKGSCRSHPECDKHCRDVEKAKEGGLCRPEGGAKKCYCYGC